MRVALSNDTIETYCKIVLYIVYGDDDADNIAHKNDACRKTTGVATKEDKSLRYDPSQQLELDNATARQRYSYSTTARQLDLAARAILIEKVTCLPYVVQAAD